MKTSKTDNSLQKTLIYQRLYQINAGFAGIAGQVLSLQEHVKYPNKHTKYLLTYLHELQAQINSSFLQPIEQIQEEDWSRFERIREKLAKQFRKRKDRGSRRKKSPTDNSGNGAVNIGPTNANIPDAPL